MPKIVIPKADLGPLNAEEGIYGSHLFRFRIVSSDKNVWSHWSPWYEQLNTSSITSSGSMTKLNTIISVTWNPVDGFNQYDVYTRWYDSTDPTDATPPAVLTDPPPPWSRQRITGNSINITKQNKELFSVIVRVASYRDLTGTMTANLPHPELNVYSAFDVPTA
jgi:hypothetical protein